MTDPVHIALPEVPGWEIVDQLGRGGMGAVYRARSRTLSQLVALKIIDPIYAGDPAFRRCFMREISTAVTLHHPHILPILNFSPDPDAGPLYFVTPIVGEEGRRSLADLLAAEGRFDPTLAASLLAQVADALVHAHSLERPLIHRDVTPSNILLKTTRSGSGHALLADFGIAFPGSQEARDAVTEPDSLVPAAGKPQYMAPEQFDDVEFGPMTARTDLYQLGVVAYQCLTGELPYQETNPIRLSDCHRRADVPRLTPEQCGDPRWRRLVAELLAKKPGDRPQSAAEVRNRLFDIARGPQGEAEATSNEEPSRPTSTATAAPQPTDAAPDETAGSAPTWVAVGEAGAASAAPARRATERVTPPTLVQTPRTGATAAGAAPQRRHLRFGRWLVLFVCLLIPAAVVALQFRADLFGIEVDRPPLAPETPEDVVQPAVDPGADPQTELPSGRGDEAVDGDGSTAADAPGESQRPPVTPEPGDDNGGSAAPAENDDPDQPIEVKEPLQDGPTDESAHTPGDSDPGEARPTQDDEPPAADGSAGDPSDSPTEAEGEAPPLDPFVPGPQQQRFEGKLARALTLAGVSDAAIATTLAGWSLPEDPAVDRITRNEFDTLLTVSKPAFDRHTLARGADGAGQAARATAQENRRLAEVKFAEHLNAWRERQPRTLHLALAETEEPVRLTLMPVRATEPAAVLRLSLDPAKHSLAPTLGPRHLPAGVEFLAPALSTAKRLTGPHRLIATTTDGLATFTIRPPGAVVIREPVTFDFGEYYPPFPGAEGPGEAVPQEAEAYTIEPLSPNERDALLAERLKSRVQLLRNDLEAFLSGAEITYGEAPQLADQALAAESRLERTPFMQRLIELSDDWSQSDDVRRAGTALEELASLQRQLAGRDQQAVNVKELSEAIARYRKEYFGLDPNGVLEAVRTEIYIRERNENADGG